ncbi:MAG: PrsW family intramembrane metalloprotease [Actinocatenispora sp.]
MSHDAPPGEGIEDTGGALRGAGNANWSVPGGNGRHRASTAAHPPVQPPPAVTHRFLTLRLPAFWMVLLLGVIGAGRISQIFADAVTLYPKASLTAFVLFTAYAIPFVLVVREVDYLEREPVPLLATALGWGGLVATSMANLGNTAVQDILAKLVSPSFSDRWAPAIAGPTNEETLKALGVVAIVLLARRHVNSVVDGFVYGALVGLGFQVVEDFVYSINAVVLAGDGDQITPVVAMFLVRGFLGGLWSHTLFTALVGAGIGYAVVRTDRSLRARTSVAVLAFLGAWTLHFIWNSPLLADGFGMGVGGLIGALLLKGIPGFVAVLLMLKVARQHEAGYYLGRLNGIEPILVAPEEMEALVTARGRTAARKRAAAYAGLRADRAVRRLQHAQSRLAVEISRSGYVSYREAAANRNPRSGALEKCVAEILAARERLMALGVPVAGRYGREQRTPLGGWSCVLAVLGLVVPGLSVLALGLAGLGTLLARRQRIAPDNRLGIGTSIAVLATALWVVVYLLHGFNGG